MASVSRQKVRFPKQPKLPVRVRWGCDKLCAVHCVQCGNGYDRAQHPLEIFGADGDGSLTPEE
ncbi:DUF3079 domain-containing protein [Vitreoscilla massiliensis]|uniref:DUF3079 domain-containing protein n=1 Tax=Vitreoscilla massiliensis TaxID=1689272 RepID=A0ABY4E4U1_9NEIS|nr:DUF3079 domain-containing protein [Vitreoscilla massiliensis]UOO90776.1 DUF3079 domain-containing protein [Vitreoscilla massiliensis]